MNTLSIQTKIDNLKNEKKNPSLTTFELERIFDRIKALEQVKQLILKSNCIKKKIAL